MYAYIPVGCIHTCTYCTPNVHVYTRVYIYITQCTSGFLLNSGRVVYFLSLFFWCGIKNDKTSKSLPSFGQAPLYSTVLGRTLYVHTCTYIYMYTAWSSTCIDQRSIIRSGDSTFKSGDQLLIWWLYNYIRWHYTQIKWWIIFLINKIRWSITRSGAHICWSINRASCKVKDQAVDHLIFHNRSDKWLYNA